MRMRTTNGSVAGLQPGTKRREARQELRSDRVRTDGATTALPNDAELVLGPRIRQLRKKAGMTLAELSRATGAAIGALSQIERGLEWPNIRTVFAIGSALGVSPASLIDPSQAAEFEESSFVVRANQRRRLVDSGGVRKDVASPVASKRLRAYYMVIDPGCSSGQFPYTHDGEEIGLVVSGRLEIQIDGVAHSLGEGDCFAFESSKPHRFANVGTRPATVFWINALL